MSSSSSYGSSSSSSDASFASGPAPTLCGSSCAARGSSVTDASLSRLALKRVVRLFCCLANFTLTFFLAKSHPHTHAHRHTNTDSTQFVCSRLDELPPPLAPALLLPSPFYEFMRIFNRFVVGRVCCCCSVSSR